MQQLEPNVAGFYPVPQPDVDGSYLSFSRSKNKYFRLLTFVEGDLFADVEHTPELLESYGRAIGEMNAKTSDFRHISTEARKFEWDLQQFELSRHCIPFIENAADRKLVEYYFLQNRENVQPKLARLRKRVIHGDINRRNVVAIGGEIAGIIDFGDINYTPLINELSIAVTYGLFGKDDPIQASLSIIKGYNRVLPLEEIEIEVLYWLIATRACINVCQAAQIKHDGRDEEYAQITVKPAWDLLRSWARISPLKFENEVRESLGLASVINESNQSELGKAQSTRKQCIVTSIFRSNKNDGGGVSIHVRCFGQNLS